MDQMKINFANAIDRTLAAAVEASVALLELA